MKDIKKKLEEFNKRWGIINDSTYGEEFEKFRIRIINVFLNIDAYIEKEGLSLFCNIMGIQEMGHFKNILNALGKEQNEKFFYRLLQTIFYLPIRTEHDSYRYNKIVYSKDQLYEKTRQAIEFSNINLAVTRKDEDIIFYPKGEKEFDEKLVNQVVTFLNANSQKHFIDALKFYQVSGLRNHIKSAEELRRSLEEFLRYKLKNSKGLDQNITELNKKLKEDKRDSFIRNIIFQIFSHLDQYFNENSKHHDGDIDSFENEFLIYQTGVLMRYIEFNLKT